MKRLLLTSAAALAAAMLPLCALADRPGDGDRIDYLNYKGERISSTEVSSNNLSNVSFSIQQYADGIAVTSGRGEYIASMKVVPWGTEKYEVTIDGDPKENVQTWITPIADPNGIATRDDGGEILCGTALRIYVRCPENAYPSIQLAYLYTLTDNEGNPYWYELSGLGLDYMAMPSFGARQLTNMATRKLLWDQITGTGNFVKDNSEPGLWYIDWYMPNEPFAIKASCKYADGKMLKTCVDMTLASLYRQVQDFPNTQPNANGESYLMAMGNYLSQDFISGLYLSQSVFISEYLSLNFLNHGTYWMNYVPWYTCFLNITSANMLLSSLDRFTMATDDERDNARAQLLTLRAHSYWRLMQFYAPRWADSNEGATLVAPLETSFNLDNLAPSSMKQIADQCYADLDQAMEIFSRTGFTRDKLMQPDLTVAKATKMRLAMLREDWNTALSLSEEIMAKAKLTTADEMAAGFFQPTDSWLWGAWNNTQINESYFNSLYYWSDQSWNACNGSYPGEWGFGVNAIDRKLFTSMEANDIRRQLFVMPESLNGISGISNVSNWYSANNVNANNICLTNSSLLNRIYTYFNQHKPEGVIHAAFCSVTNPENHSGITLGAQHKFYQPGPDQFSDAAIPFLRTEEVLLSGAEAAAQCGNNAKAAQLLNMLRKARKCSEITATGDILSLIRTERRLELWGEGHSWFDQKRWKLPIHRTAYVPGDTNSGNWPAAVRADIPVTEGNGWRLAVPSQAVTLNPLLNPESMGYTGVDGYDTPSSAPAAVPAKATDFRSIKTNGAPAFNREIMTAPASAPSLSVK